MEAENSSKTLDHLKFCIERSDHYYDTINNKGAFFLGLNTFILGGIIAVYSSSLHFLKDLLLTNICLNVIVLFGIVSIGYTLLSIIPYLKSNSTSIFFFGEIANRSANDFLKILDQNGSDLKDTYAQQAVELSKGLDYKFNKQKIAGILILLEFLLMIPVFIQLIIQLHK